MKGFAMRQIYTHLERDPEQNVPKLLDALERFDRDAQGLTNELKAIRNALGDPENNWSKLVRSLWTDIDAGQRKKLVETAVINASLIGTPYTTELQERYGCNIPWAILVDPTSACNLRCIGCWAAEYGNRMNLSFRELDDIIEQGKELGTYVYLYSGGEPLVRKDDLIRLCEKHDDCAFLAFTNGTLIDEAFADELLRVGNFVPAISIEGFEEETDFRRGKGTYRAVVRATEILRERKLLFGTSCCYTAKNAEIIGSEEYFDAMIAMGAKFAWFFTYMPIGADAVPELMTSASQRKYMFEQIRRFRKTKPLFTMDFWNDGDAVGGCIAAGRGFLHINANGDVEPCAFIHYSDSNIREKSLLKALQSPLFATYRHNQPFNANMLRPCPVLDNPGMLTQMVWETGAHSTDLMSPEDAHAYSRRCVPAAKEWASVAEKLWEELPDRRGVQTTGKMAKKG